MMKKLFIFAFLINTSFIFCMGPYQETLKRDRLMAYFAKNFQCGTTPKFNVSFAQIAVDAINNDDDDLFNHCAPYLSMDELNQLRPLSKQNSTVKQHIIQLIEEKNSGNPNTK